MNFKKIKTIFKSFRVIVKPLLAAVAILILISFYTGHLGRLVNRVDSKLGIIKNIFNVEHSLSLEFPEYEKQSPKFKSLLKDQWMGDKGNFLIVAKDNASYYARPDETTKPLGQLSYTKRVQLIFVVDKTQNEENNVWGFISHEGGKVPIGWILLDDLARPSLFKPLSRWDYDDFLYKKGQYIGDLHVKKNGHFFIKWQAEGNGLRLKGKYFGKFYAFENILWAKKSEFNIWKDFFYDDNGSLKQEVRFPDGLIEKNQEVN